MQFLAYLLIYPIIWFISILPFKLLYLFSDLLYVVFYYIVKYRRKTVRKHLEMALPHLSEKERLEVEKKSYKHQCDMFLEMIKTLNISRKEMERRFVFTNLEIYKELEAKQKSVAIMFAHYASYEWAVSMNNYLNFKGYGIYKRIKNPYFDNLVKKIRLVHKATLITTKETTQTIEENNSNKVLAVYGFISDQTPGSVKNSHWYRFMGIETPIHIGAEVLAKRFDMSVVFLRTKKVKRGFYEATLEVLTDDARSIPDYKISETFMQKVEEQIYEAPEFYMWTHKRWKHKKENQ